MPGLIDVDTGLKFGDGLAWLLGGLGGDGFDNIPISATTMVVESPDNTLMLTELSERMLTESAAPSWVLTAGGFEATLDIDFVGDQAWLIPAETTIASLLTCTRATPALAYYTKADGTLITFAPNTLRYGTNGLLVEEARTNLCIQSQTFDDPAWSQNNVSVTANQIAAPDGTLTADLITLTTAGGSIVQAFTNTAAVYSWSGYAKLGTSPYLWFDAYENGTDHVTWFNLTNGTIGTNAAGNTASIEALANGWYRLTITRSSAAGASNAAVKYGFVDADNSFSGTIGRTTYLWGSQNELGAFATSYIPTTTASVTRAADVVTFSSITPFLGAASTFYTATNLLNPGAGTPRIVGTTTGGVTPIFRNNDTSIGSYNGSAAVTATIASSGHLSTDVVKSASCYDGAGRSICANAGTVGTDTNTMGTPDIVALGSDGSSNFMCGYIPRFTYWTLRQSNAALQTLTTP